MTIREYRNISEIIVEIPQDISYIVNSPSDTTEVYLTMVENVVGTLSSGIDVSFNDNNPSNDTITRTKGSWKDDGFGIGMTIIVSGSINNDGTYTITDISDDTLTLSSGDVLVNEANVSGVSIVGNIPSTDWVLFEVIANGGKFNLIELSPTGIKFVKTTSNGNVDVWIRS